MPAAQRKSKLDVVSSRPNQKRLSRSDLPQSYLLLHSKEKRRLLIPKHHVEYQKRLTLEELSSLGSQTAGTTTKQQLPVFLELGRA